MAITRRGRRQRVSTLSNQLTWIFVALLAGSFLLLGCVSTVLMYRYFTQTVDEQLRSSGVTVGEQILSDLAAGNPAEVGEAGASNYNISNYYIFIDYTDPTTGRRASAEQISTMTQAEFGRPTNITALLNSATNRSVTVDGTQGKDWRVLVQSVVTSGSGTHLEVGKVVIGQPFSPVQRNVTRLFTVFLFTALALAVLGAILVWASVRRTLRSLHDIEVSTHSIAAGNLAMRVPHGHDEDEVGQLATSINMMLSHIEQAFNEKEASERRMRQFVSDASHELRTPLATVRGYAELYRLGGIPADKMDQSIGRIESEANRMSGLVQDLLQLARLDEGRPLSLSKVNLRAVAEDAVSDLRVRDDSHPAAVTGPNGSEPPAIIVTADQNRVTQMITNLLSNVLTHTPAGTPVEVVLSTAGNQAFVDVQDHGPGVPADKADRIFERFYRTDTSRSRQSGGSGLGLAIVAAVMAAHGGSAHALQTPGGGLTIRLAFPLGTEKENTSAQ